MHMASGRVGSAASVRDKEAVVPGCRAPQAPCDWQVLPARGQRQHRQSRSFGGRSVGLSLPPAFYYLPPRANGCSATVPSYQQDERPFNTRHTIKRLHGKQGGCLMDAGQGAYFPPCDPRHHTVVLYAGRSRGRSQGTGHGDDARCRPLTRRPTGSLKDQFKCLLAV